MVTVLRTASLECTRRGFCDRGCRIRRRSRASDARPAGHSQVIMRGGVVVCTSAGSVWAHLWLCVRQKHTQLIDRCDLLCAYL
jgi:hypothetical protein